MLIKKIVSLCKQRNISIAQLEREIGLGNGTIGGWKKSSPTIDNVKKVAEFFCVTIDSLVYE